MPGRWGPWWERFWAYVPERSGPRGCREWAGARDAKGYGVLTIYKGESQRAPRLAWMLAFGEIPPGLYVLHRCDNPPCVEISHLFLGDARDNIRDARAKGRIQQGFQAGEAHRNAKLTVAQVRDIRAAWATGKVTQPALAKQYGVGQGAISAIVLRRTWRNITDIDYEGGNHVTA